MDVLIKEINEKVSISIATYLANHFQFKQNNKIVKPCQIASFITDLMFKSSNNLVNDLDGMLGVLEPNLKFVQPLPKKKLPKLVYNSYGDILQDGILNEYMVCFTNISIGRKQMLVAFAKTTSTTEQPLKLDDKDKTIIRKYLKDDPRDIISNDIISILEYNKKQKSLYNRLNSFI